MNSTFINKLKSQICIAIHNHFTISLLLPEAVCYYNGNVYHLRKRIFHKGYALHVSNDISHPYGTQILTFKDCIDLNYKLYNI